MKRRALLQAAGVTLALPGMESLRAKESPSLAETRSRSESSQPPMRMVCVGNEFGMYPGAFWPKNFGRDFESTPLLKPLDDHRDDVTLFSNLDHGLKGGHFAVHTFLTGVKFSEAKAAPDGGISLDQRAAEHVGSATRFPSLTVGSESGLHGGCQMSWTRTGTRVPPIQGPRELFTKLFVNDDKKSKQRANERINLQESILDAVMGDAKSLGRRLSKDDRTKLDEYLSSVREVEQRLDLDRKWQSVPKPEATLERPKDEGLTRDLPKIYDLIALALQTDQSRIATLEIGGSFAASDLGIRKGYHSLSHHGKRKENIDLLVQIESYQVAQYARFLERLKSIRQVDSNATLLDSTMVLLGSGMGNANSHTNNDLPVLLGGGGFRHGTHLELPAKKDKRVPLCNLYLSMLERFGVQANSFSTSTGTLPGLEVA